MKKITKKTYKSPRVKVMPVTDTSIMCASGDPTFESGGDAGNQDPQSKINFKFLD